MSLALLLAACRGGDEDALAARGKGLHALSLPDTERVRIYGTALRTAFEPDPKLSILIYPEFLPRASGYGSAPALPAELLRALLQLESARGTCGPYPDSIAEQGSPRCAAGVAGYVVRLSPVLGLGTDSVEVYLAAQRYDLPGGTPRGHFIFERAYQLVRRHGRWRVVREGRIAAR